MIRFLTVITAVCIPLVLLTIKSIPFYFVPGRCMTHVVQINEMDQDISVSDSKWLLTLSGSSLHGLFTGHVNVFDPAYNLRGSYTVNRNFTMDVKIVAGHLETRTSRSSKLVGDNYSDKFIATNISPQLVEGQTTMTRIFKTTDGTFISGLDNKPRIFCNFIK